MTKKLIVVAVGGLLAAPAMAQSNITLTGFLALSYNNHKVTNTARPAATENRLDDASSRFILRGTEDLGSGMSAYFQIENRFSPDTRPNSTFGNAQGLADGESFVGVKSNSLGQIGFGKFAMHYNEGLALERYRAQHQQILVGQNLLSEVNGTKVATGSRSQNTIKYDTPTWAGFSAKIIYSFNPAGNEGTLTNTGAAGGCSPQYTNNAATCTLGSAANSATNNQYNKGRAWNVAGNYSSGPVRAFVSFYDWTAENGTRASGQKSWRVGGDYAFPFGLAVGLAYDHSKVLGATSSADNKRSAWMLPVSYITGPHGVFFTYGKANSRSGVSDSGAQQYSLAYDYAFSKRTFVGVSYINLKNQSNARYQLWNAGTTSQGGSEFTVNGEDGRIFSVNLTHRF